MGRKYRYMTILVSLCKEFEDRKEAFRAIAKSNELSIINALRKDGEIKVYILLGKVTGLKRYTEPKKETPELYNIACIVLRKYYIKLPYPMDAEESVKFIEKETGIKPPVEDDSEIAEKLLEKYGRVKLDEWIR